MDIDWPVGSCSVFSYRRSEVVSDLVGESHVRDRRRHVLAVIQQSDNARVQRLHAAPVVLE